MRDWGMGNQHSEGAREGLCAALLGNLDWGIRRKVVNQGTATHAGHTYGGGWRAHALVQAGVLPSGVGTDLGRLTAAEREEDAAYVAEAWVMGGHGGQEAPSGVVMPRARGR